MKNKVLRFKLTSIIGLSLILSLSACTIGTIKPDISYSRPTMMHLYEVENWAFTGRLAVTGKNESWSANISWEHTPEVEKIKIFGPLGQGAIVISLAGNVVTIDRGGGDVQASAQPEEFINQQLGIFVPLRSLRYWVVGLPEPSRTYKDTNVGFSQSGWISEYGQMQAVNENEIMPRKMTVINKQVKLKLIIDQWDF